MKIAVISDTHFGVRNDSPLFLEYSFKFFEEIFFPYLDAHGIDTVIHMGDLLDRRKYVNFNTLNQVKRRFFEPLKSRGVSVHIIPGNHDTYWKNTNTLNSLKELFQNDVHLYESPTKVMFEGCPILFVPWINKENESECMEAINSSRARVCVGHFEFLEFEVMRGVKSSVGHSFGEVAKRYDLVLSGHFHCKQNQGNVWYLGTQYDLTFSDVHEVKGFHVLDTETMGLEFVQNPHKMYHKIYYDDAANDYSNFPLSTYKDTYLRIVVSRKTNDLVFSALCEGLVGAGVANLSVVEELAEEASPGEGVDISKGTLELINDAIDEYDLGVNRDRLKGIVRELYVDSLSV